MADSAITNAGHITTSGRKLEQAFMRFCRLMCSLQGHFRMTATRFLLAMVVIAAFLGVPSPARSDDDVPADVCDRPEDCQSIFQAESRDEPWSSRLENELRTFLSARAELALKMVECRKTLCSIVASISGESTHPWAMAMIEMHAMPWYADFYGDSGTASGPNQVEISPGLWRPNPTGTISIRWFLERKPAAAN